MPLVKLWGRCSKPAIVLHATSCEKLNPSPVALPDNCFWLGFHFPKFISDELGSYGDLWQGPTYPAYLRREAYLRLHNGSAAAAEFQKFVDHRAVLANFPTGSLAHLGLARAYVCKATTAKPAPHTKTFSRFGKMPIPISWSSKQAKAEYCEVAVGLLTEQADPRCNLIGC